MIARRTVLLSALAILPTCRVGGLPFDLYQFTFTHQTSIPVQPYYPGIDYTEGASQIAIVTVPNVLQNDLIEAEAVVGVSVNGLPYSSVVGASICWNADQSLWGSETFGEDVSPQRPYLTIHQTIDYVAARQDKGDVPIRFCVYAGSSGSVQPGDHLITMWANGRPTGHFYVRRWPAQGIASLRADHYFYS